MHNALRLIFWFTRDPLNYFNFIGNNLFCHGIVDQSSSYRVAAAYPSPSNTLHTVSLILSNNLSLGK